MREINGLGMNWAPCSTEKIVMHIPNGEGKQEGERIFLN